MLPAPVPTFGEGHQDSIHTDPLNFERYFEDQSQCYESIAGIYQGIPFEPDLNKPTVMCFIAPSGGGKDAVLDKAMDDDLPVHHVTTATTRERRKHLDPPEEENKYVWMRAQRQNENVDEYIANLVMEHELIEYDFHHGNLYGLPLDSIRRIVNMPGTIPVIRNESKGAITLAERLSPQFNVLTLAILPDNMQQLEEAARAREHPELRLKENEEIIGLFSQVANFYLHNTRKAVNLDGRIATGLERSIMSLRQLLIQLKLIA